MRNYYFEYEDFKKRFLSAYYGKIIESNKTEVYIQGFLVNKYSFALTQILFGMYIIKYSKFELKKKLTSYALFTLCNINLTLRNSLTELRKKEFNSLECFGMSYTSPTFCIRKDITILKLISVVLLPYKIYLEMQKLR